jgi:bacillithiol biosynthesis cysteine-adding enzyme BshC
MNFVDKKGSTSMEMLNLSLPANNRFATDYLAQTPDIQQFFHYRYQEASDYIERVEELKKRSFLRQEVAEHIELFMDRFPSSPQVNHSIEKLKNEDSVVVIGGQQAGVLTGPLYTIHKVISIIVLANQKEKELGIPVVPVFWIAGEDHDYMEVNHVFAEVDKRIKKVTYPEVVFEKKMVSDIRIDKVKCFTWVEKIIETFGETDHTKELLSFAHKAIEQSETFVDFFAFIIMEMFKEFGLLIIDSGNKKLRSLESSFFIRQITDNKKMTEVVFNQQQKLKQFGFSQAIEINENAANIFYYDEVTQSRILLEFQPENNLFVGKNGSIQFSFDTLIEIASGQPERLSNNVVTRPLMQEWLFPTLAFIAGPGEIAYWSELKQVFEHFQIKMPPIVPRLNITLLERSVETDIHELGWDLNEVIRDGITKLRALFIDSVKDPDLAQHFLYLKMELTKQYHSILAKSEPIDKGLLPLIKKNEAILLKQIQFIETKIEESIEKKHEVILQKMDRVGNSLRPSGSPQERVLNPFYFFNKYGFGLVGQLTKLDYQFDGNHKVIKI